MPSHSSRKANSENTPPSTRMGIQKSKVHGGIQNASRRRRARATGGPNHPRYAVQQAKRKSTTRSWETLVDLGVSRAFEDVPEFDTTSAMTVSFPRYLSRPVFGRIEEETIASVAPELVGTALPYIRQGLELLGPGMLRVLAGVQANPAANVLPKELSVVVNDVSSDMPTHMLAVYSRAGPAEAKRRVTLFPIHHIIFAIHCTNLPTLSRSSIARPDTPGSTISVPVVPLCIPAPEVFHHLSTFLYTKRIDHLLGSILPCPVPPSLYCDDPMSERVFDDLQQHASKLATRYRIPILLAHAITVNGLWRNACALGIDDEKLWCALDVAWEVLLSALAIATGHID